MPKAIIIGASSGIGAALARTLDQAGYELGLCARRYDRLQALAGQLRQPPCLATMDVRQIENANIQLQALIAQLGDVDLIVLNSGVGDIDFDLSWDNDANIIDTNVRGIAALAAASYRYFRQRKAGHLVGVSSILCLRGGPATAYNASKAFLSSYLDGIRFLLAKQKLDIKVSDIRPGFVDTDIVRGKTFWMVSPERAATDIYKAIRKQRKVAYITPRWRLIAWLARLIPDRWYHKM